MSQRVADTAVVHKVELVILRLDSLSTLPCVAARFLSQLLQPQFSPSTLAETIESDPALTAKVLSLMHQQHLSFSDEEFSLHQLLDKLPVHLVRDAVLSVKVLQAQDDDEKKVLSREELLLHSLAVACCAKDIAEIASPRINSRLAYSAGLLHNIGNLALHQAMPKSFARIVEEAKSRNVSICDIERKLLGTDYTILGKRLAQKWHFPGEIALAIWLHHSDTCLISQTMPEARIAQIVQLADSIARQCSIGQSGSFDAPVPAEQIAQSLAITPEQLQQIRHNLPGTVAQKSKVLGLDLPKPQASYYDIVHTTAAQLARDNTKLSLENRRLQTSLSHSDFITDFLSSINSAAAAIEVAESFAARWQKFYQTGPVCLYLAPSAGSEVLESVVVEGPSQIKMVYLNAPADSPPIPKVIQNNFAILNAQDYIDWLSEQLDVDFELNQTKIMPLLSNGKAIGAIVFEFRYPASSEQLQERFKAVTSIAGAILDMASVSAKQQRFAERFAQLIAKLKTTQRQPTSDSSLNALAEMAAGAAHELNNPLSVISGRAQILAETETDPEKKQILKQIQENTNEISYIVDELMAFARPQQPRPAQTSIEQILDEAIQMTAQKQNTEQLDVQINVAEAGEKVFVDSAQIVSAIANIFSNSLESYTGDLAPIKVTADADESGDFVKLAISDLGCGMDRQTQQRATQPFFSARPAGRKRGMGLAHAARLIQLNNGSLSITSQPGSGTTVTIFLPCK